MCCACISIFSVCSLLNTAAFAAEWERADAVACRRTTRYSNKYVICMIAVCANLWGSTNLTYQNKLLNFEEMARVYPALASPSTKKSSNRHADTHSTHVYAQVWWKKWRHTHREKGKKMRRRTPVAKPMKTTPDKYCVWKHPASPAASSSDRRGRINLSNCSHTHKNLCFFYCFLSSNWIGTDTVFARMRTNFRL